MQKAMFGAGCFWGVEAAFRRLEGVVDATSGYSGGHAVDPDYRSVCSGTTGHAEVVLVEFDPDKVAYDELLAAFWDLHDPTSGPSTGRRSSLSPTLSSRRPGNRGRRRRSG